jgi:homoserine O-succinyltransferase
MPLKVVSGLPAAEKLKAEGVNISSEQGGLNQAVRPLRILILNLMPTKETTEVQLLRLIGASPLEIEVDFLRTSTYKSKNVSARHLDNFYKILSEVEDAYYDGLIVTGAPVEQMPFEEVSYYDELIDIFKWSEEHVYSRFFICWGAQAALHYYYGIEKNVLPEKSFGVYSFEVLEPAFPFLRGFDDSYFVPVSRHTLMNGKQIEEEADLAVLSKNNKLGIDLIASADQRDLYMFGHLEYDRETLEVEYKRDVAKGLAIDVPENYYPGNDPNKKPVVRWKSHAYLLFTNWINEIHRKTLYD